MSFLDKLKQKADEMGLKEKAEHVADEAKKMAEQAKEKAGDLAAENKEKVESAFDKAAAKIDEKTEGKYSDKLAKAKEQVSKGVDKIAEGGSHPHDAETDTSTGTPSTGTPTSDTAAGAAAAAGTAAGTVAGTVTDAAAAAAAEADEGLLSNTLADEEEVAEDVLAADDVDPEAPLDSPPSAGTPRGSAAQRMYDESGEPIDDEADETDAPGTPPSSGSW